jgi:hypothetical protein
MTTARLSQRPQRILRWLAADHQADPRGITSSHQELVRVLQRGKGNISHSLQTLEERGWPVIGRSSGGKAASLSGSPQRVRNGVPSLQEVVIKKKRAGKQIVISSDMSWK